MTHHQAFTNYDRPEYMNWIQTQNRALGRHSNIVAIKGEGSGPSISEYGAQSIENLSLYPGQENHDAATESYPGTLEYEAQSKENLSPYPGRENLDYTTSVPDPGMLEYIDWIQNHHQDNGIHTIMGSNSDDSLVTDNLIQKQNMSMEMNSKYSSILHEGPELGSSEFEVQSKENLVLYPGQEIHDMATEPDPSTKESSNWIQKQNQDDGMDLRMGPNTEDSLNTIITLIHEGDIVPNPGPLKDDIWVEKQKADSEVNDRIDSNAEDSLNSNQIIMDEADSRPDSGTSEYNSWVPKQSADIGNSAKTLERGSDSGTPVYEHQVATNEKNSSPSVMIHNIAEESESGVPRGIIYQIRISDPYIEKHNAENRLHGKMVSNTDDFSDQTLNSDNWIQKRNRGLGLNLGYRSVVGGGPDPGTSEYESQHKGNLSPYPGHENHDAATGPDPGTSEYIHAVQKQNHDNGINTRMGSNTDDTFNSIMKFMNEVATAPNPGTSKDDIWMEKQNADSKVNARVDSNADDSLNSNQIVMDEVDSGPDSGTSEYNSWTQEQSADIANNAKMTSISEWGSDSGTPVDEHQVATNEKMTLPSNMIHGTAKELDSKVPGSYSNTVYKIQVSNPYIGSGNKAYTPQPGYVHEPVWDMNPNILEGGPKTNINSEDYHSLRVSLHKDNNNQQDVLHKIVLIPTYNKGMYVHNAVEPSLFSETISQNLFDGNISSEVSAENEDVPAEKEIQYNTDQDNNELETNMDKISDESVDNLDAQNTEQHLIQGHDFSSLIHNKDYNLMNYAIPQNSFESAKIPVYYDNKEALYPVINTPQEEFDDIMSTKLISDLDDIDQTREVPQNEDKILKSGEDYDELKLISDSIESPRAGQPYESDNMYPELEEIPKLSEEYKTPLADFSVTMRYEYPNTLSDPVPNAVDVVPQMTADEKKIPKMPQQIIYQGPLFVQDSKRAIIHKNPNHIISNKDDSSDLPTSPMVLHDHKYYQNHIYQSNVSITTKAIKEFMEKYTKVVEHLKKSNTPENLINEISSKLLDYFNGQVLKCLSNLNKISHDIDNIVTQAMNEVPKIH